MNMRVCIIDLLQGRVEKIDTHLRPAFFAEAFGKHVPARNWPCWWVAGGCGGPKHLALTRSVTPPVRSIATCDMQATCANGHRGQICFFLST